MKKIVSCIFFTFLIFNIYKIIKYLHFKKINYKKNIIFILNIVKYLIKTNGEKFLYPSNLNFFIRIILKINLYKK